MTHIHDYSTDWREQLRRNERRTKMVIFTFILLYFIVGVFIDITILHWTYNFTLKQSWYVIIHEKYIPYATIIMSGVALLSLWIAYTLYDRIILMGTEYREIMPNSSDSFEERQLYNLLEEMKVAAGLSYMPRLFVIEANYMNAFASGYSEKSAMVAVTRGLLNKLNRSEMQAVMAHELSHIRHHDIKLTLTVAILSNILLLAIDLLFYGALMRNNNRQNREGNQLFFMVMLLRYVLPILTVLLGLYLSRTREFMADTGCVELMRDNEPLAKALIKIEADHKSNIEEYHNEYSQKANEDIRRTAYIFDPAKAGIQSAHSLTSLFSTHPSLKERLAALGIKIYPE